MSNAWSLLGKRQKLRLVRKLALQRRREWMRWPNVVNVGWGRRERDEELTDEICLRFRVRKKWASKRRRDGSIPRSVMTYAEVRGRRRRVFVPCDVEALPPVTLQAETGGHACSGAGFGLDVRGTATCVVHRKWNPQPTFLLGCDHVLALTLRRDPPAFHQLSSVEARLGSQRVGHLAEIGFGVDAALAEITAPQIATPSFQGDHGPFAASGFLADALSIPFDYRILTRSGASVPATLKDILPSISVSGYFGGNPRHFDTVIVSRTAIPTAAGWSGAPLVDANNRLLGMHFAGITGATVSYALPIRDVFESFDPPVRLTL